MGFIQRNLPFVVMGLALALLVLGVLGYMQTQRDLPPRDFTILVDEQGSGCYDFAESYRDIFRARGVDLSIRTTSGASETLSLLAAGEAGSALVPGFMTNQLRASEFSSLGALFDEPLWVFYNKAAFNGQPVEFLAQLQGKRVGIGLPGSGSQALALQLLNESSVTRANTALMELSRQDEVDQLIAGGIDAAVLLDAYQAAAVQALLHAPEVGLAALRQAQAYTARQNALKVLELPEGVINLAANIPDKTTPLLSSAANLVIRNDLTPTLARALMMAAMLVHARGDYFAKPYTYPNLSATDLPVLPEYVDYFNRLKNGSLLFGADLPFWSTYAVERFIFFLLPMLVLVGLLVIYFPAVWRFYMQGKLIPGYQQLRRIEIELPKMNQAQTAAASKRLHTLEAQVTRRVHVSGAYLPELFLLRSHIREVLADVEQHQQTLAQPATPGDQAPDEPTEELPEELVDAPLPGETTQPS